MDQPLYHVLLQGRRIGPYDRRTIVGMRIKKTLTSADLVVAGNGQQFTVADLVKMGRPDGGFEASRSGSYSVVQVVHSAALVEAKGAIPRFRDEIEVRLQTKALRLAGRFRTGVGGWKEDRVKIPLSELVHARARGSLVELALRQGGAGKLQRLVLELFTPDAAAELVGALPALAPWPDSGKPIAASGGPHPMVWGAVVGTALIVGSVLVWVLTHRG